MKKILQYIGLSLFSIAIIAGFYFGIKQNTATASIQDGQSYMATTTDSTWSAVAGSIKVLKVGPGTFGSVIITTNTTGLINVYDGTTTSSTIGTTTIAKFGASATTNTYTFDVAFAKGLVIENPTGSLASTTITWR